MTALVPTLTLAGLNAVFNTEGDGLQAKLTHIVLGDQGRTPKPSHTKLGNQRRRIAIADGEKTADRQLHITGVVDGEGPEFWVREVGFELEDGTLLAIWSDTQPLAYVSNNVPLLLAFDLRLDALPADSVTIETSGANLSLVAWGEQYIANSAAIIDTMARQVDLLFRVHELEKRS
ncbi:phage tail-collar fiber domain-containing protein [Halomonas sp.]|uniref:phage tail-collar fiber domain-containing protein n=1 Tax=Halomonas sp. TaxID=1486246 RepID=UPI003F8F8A98